MKWPGAGSRKHRIRASAPRPPASCPPGSFIIPHSLPDRCWRAATARGGGSLGEQEGARHALGRRHGSWGERPLTAAGSPRRAQWRRPPRRPPPRCRLRPRAPWPGARAAPPVRLRPHPLPGADRHGARLRGREHDVASIRATVASGVDSRRGRVGAQDPQGSLPCRARSRASQGSWQGKPARGGAEHLARDDPGQPAGSAWVAPGRRQDCAAGAGAREAGAREAGAREEEEEEEERLHAPDVDAVQERPTPQTCRRCGPAIAGASAKAARRTRAQAAAGRTGRRTSRPAWAPRPQRGRASALRPRSGSGPRGHGSTGSSTCPRVRRHDSQAEHRGREEGHATIGGRQGAGAQPGHGGGRPWANVRAGSVHTPRPTCRP
jgi:hypothetical protein